MKRSIKATLVLLAGVALLAGPAALAAQEKPPADESATLLQLDREFDQATAERGVEGWVAYFADNGSMLMATGAPITGPEAIRAAMAGALGNPDFSLRWQPTRAEMLIPGVLGCTVGRYQRRTKNAEGKSLLQEGTYVTVWRRQADGSWKIVLDTGSADGPPQVVD